MSIYLNLLESELLASWEESFLKGQLTLWILLALKDSPKHAKEVFIFIGESTKQRFTPESQSVYRALRRYHNVDIVTYTLIPSSNGPHKKIYQLSASGKRLLEAFLQKNIVPIYYDKSIKSLIIKRNS